MSNIVSFPTKSVQDWVKLEKHFREALSLSCASDELENIVIERMRTAYEEHKLNYQLSFNLAEKDASHVEEQLKEFERAVQERTHKLLQSRLVLEVKLAKAQGIS